MAIRNEDTATNEILKDARYHLATIKAHPNTRPLAAGTETAIIFLREKQTGTERAEDARVEQFALLHRADFEIDERTRTTELDALVIVNKDRNAIPYRACFPNGLVSILSLRGEEQARATRTLTAQLRENLQSVATKHASDLDQLATSVVDVERAWHEAERAAGAAFAEEVIARIGLVRQLQKNEGALAELFPGQRRRVRSFFRPTRRRGAVTTDGSTTDTSSQGAS